MTPTMTLIRCDRCGRVLGDYRMTEGEIRIRCVRSGCKKENIIRVRPNIEGETNHGTIFPSEGKLQL